MVVLHTEASPSVDGGYGYVVLIAATSVFFFIGGVANTGGLLLIEHGMEFPEASMTMLSLPSGLMSGFFLLAGPLTAILVKRFGCRPVAFTGGVITTISVAMSTRAQTIEMFVICYGVFAGIGLGLIYLPSITMINTYFNKKRGVVVGIVTSGSGVGLLVMAYVIDRLMLVYGWRGCYLIIAGIYLNLCVCACLMRPLEDNFPKVRNDRREDPCEESDREQHEEKPEICGAHEDENDEDSRSSDKPLLNGNADVQNGNILNSEYTAKSESTHGSFNVESENLNGKSVQNGNGHVPVSPFSECVDSKIKSEVLDSKLFSSLPNVMITKEDPTEDQNEDEDKLSKENHHCLSTHLYTPRHESASSHHHNGQNHSLLQQLLDGKHQHNNQTHHLHRRHHHNHHQSHEHFGSRSTIDCKDLTPHELAVLEFVEGKKEMLNIPPECLSVSVSTMSINSIKAKSLHSLHLSQSALSLKSRSRSTLASKAKSRSILSIEEELEQEVIAQNYNPFSLFKIVGFDLFCAGAFLIQIAASIPAMFTPSFAISVGLDVSTSATIVSVLGISNTIGRLSAGVLAYFNFGTVRIYNAGTFLAGVACFFLPFCINYWSLLLFAITHGFFIGFFPPLQSIILVEQLGLERLSASFGIMCLCKSIASMFGPSFAGALFEMVGSYNMPFFFAGGILLVSNVLHCIMSFCKKPQL